MTSLDFDVGNPSVSRQTLRMAGEDESGNREPTGLALSQKVEILSNTCLVGVRCEVIVPGDQSDFGPLSTEHADDVVLDATIHRQHLI